MKSSDFINILLLELPVRCSRCRQRQAVPFTVSALSSGAETQEARRARHKKRKATQDMSWTQWTAGTAPEPGTATAEEEFHGEEFDA